MSEAFDAEEHVRTPQDCLEVWRAQLPFFVAEPVPELERALEDVVFQPDTLRAGPEEVYDVRDDLRAVGELAVLAIGGAEDRCFPAEHTREIAELAPRGTAVVLDDAGHFAYAERPEEYLEALRGFLLSHPRPSQARVLRGDVTKP